MGDDSPHVVPGDPVLPYLLLSNSHDGSGAVRIALTTVRVVCWNTLSVALRHSRSTYSIRHVGDVSGRVRQARQALGLAADAFTEYVDTARRMAGHTPGQNQVRDYLLALFPALGDAKPSGRTKAAAERIVANWQADRRNNVAGMAGSAWGLVNAATQYADHERSTTGKGRERDENRLNAAWFGSGADFKAAAWQAATDMLPALAV